MCIRDSARSAVGAPALVAEAAGTPTADLAELGPLASRALRLIESNAVAFRDDAAAVPGIHLIVEAARAADVWKGLLSRFGEATGIGKRPLRPAGWAAYNATRIEGGRPLLGVDFEAVPVPTAYPARRQREEQQQAEAPSVPGVLPV